MTAIAILGTSSGAGKSLLVTGICASLARRGVRVAPFKAQNMSNNARVVDGGEIGAAQWFQAHAAGIAASVHHNPVLLKPEADTRSQVIVHGQVNRELTEMPWRARAGQLWSATAQSYEWVRAHADVIVIEGAGSPAEINLIDVDAVNHRIVDHADATIALVSDIDRGGSFAHLYGTWALVGDAMRPRIRGFVLNKFRGDAALLEPAPTMLQSMTGVPTIGVVPMIDHGLPDEDGADPRPTSNGSLRVRVVRGPAASNLDEWWPLRATTSFAWATSPEHLLEADLIVLPGSKLVSADLAWARSTGMAEAVADAHRNGIPMIAVCGGIQFLGASVRDPHLVEKPAEGLGLLPISTTFSARKRVVSTTATFAAGLPEPWTRLSGLAVTGYELRYGDSVPTAASVKSVMPHGLAYLHENVLATYLHGLVENDVVLEAIVGRCHPRPLPSVMTELADVVDTHLDVERLLEP